MRHVAGRLHYVCLNSVAAGTGNTRTHTHAHAHTHSPSLPPPFSLSLSLTHTHLTHTHTHTHAHTLQVVGRGLAPWRARLAVAAVGTSGALRALRARLARAMREAVASSPMLPSPTCAFSADQLQVAVVARAAGVGIRRTRCEQWMRWCCGAHPAARTPAL